jgi:hypothetical protein
LLSGEDGEFPVAYDIPLGETPSQRLRDFDAYWRSKMQPGRLPARGDIDPADIKPLLPYLMIVDLEFAPFRVRYRLSGTKIDDYNGVLTNRYLDEIDLIPPDMQARIITLFQSTIRERRPFFVRDYLVTLSGSRHPVYGGVWPLSSDGSTIDQCIAMEDYPDDIQYDLEILR